MQLIETRKYCFLDALALEERQARDTLFKTDDNAFLLHMTSGEHFENERLVSLDARCALLWINATPDEYGLNWE